MALYLLGPIGMAIVQEAFNRSGAPVVDAAATTKSSVYQPGTTVLPPLPPTKNTAPIDTTTNPPKTT